MAYHTEESVFVLIANDSIQPRYVVVGEGATTTKRLGKAHERLERGARLLVTNRTTGGPFPAGKLGLMEPAPPPPSWKPALAGELITWPGRSGQLHASTLE